MVSAGTIMHAMHSVYTTVFQRVGKRARGYEARAPMSTTLTTAPEAMIQLLSRALSRCAFCQAFTKLSRYKEEGVSHLELVSCGDLKAILSKIKNGMRWSTQISPIRITASLLFITASLPCAVKRIIRRRPRQ